jgi:hypothetical protein
VELGPHGAVPQKGAARKPLQEWMKARRWVFGSRGHGAQ